MDKELQNKINRLRSQIDDLRYRYHVLNDPEVTDAMYQGLMDKLQKIEDTHPELITPDSPTQRIAGEPAEKFRKVHHVVPQWSFNDAFTHEDLENWEERILKYLEKTIGHRSNDLDYCVELKIDGLHMVLIYKKGLLEIATTRGDGKVGEDVTANIKTIQSVPLKLRESVSLVAEGEVWMPREMLDEINKKRKITNELQFANPRNAAAGTIRQLNPKIVAERKLQLTTYDISAGEIPETQAKELERLRDLGFKTDTHWKVCKNLKEIFALYDEWDKKRNSQPFWIDGLVIKVNQRKYQDALGFTGKAPRWAIALKFPAEQGTTRIKDIYVQVGRTGALTPVALMEPVQLAGTTVTHATLHNFDEIKRLGVRVGDMVVVEKAGDIIPKVVRILEKMRTGDEKKVKEIKKCPVCESPVERRNIVDKKQQKSVALFCTNNACYARELKNIIHFVSKKAFNIDGMGKKIVEQLVNEGLIKNIADIFMLTKDDVEPLERFADKSAKNFVDAIITAKKVTLPRFLFSLGIPHVGEETAIRLAEYFGSLQKIQDATVEAFQNVPDVGHRVAESLFNFFHNKKNENLLKALHQNGVIIEKNEKNETVGKLAGKIFVLTGSLPNISREEATKHIRILGGHISSHVSHATDYVVAGKKPGSKYTKAKKLGIQIIGEIELKKLIYG